MFQRKSREESHGEGSGVEIIENEPYEDGPGGKGQYTYKIYHVGSHLPGMHLCHSQWVRHLIVTFDSRIGGSIPECLMLGV